MSRSFRDLMKFSVPALLSAALLAGCGSGSNGSADLDDGGSVASPPPPALPALHRRVGGSNTRPAQSLRRPAVRSSL